MHDHHDHRALFRTRFHERVPVRVPVTVTGENNALIRGETDNVSEGGLALHFDPELDPYRPWPLGREVSVELTLPLESRSTVFRANVVWRTAPGEDANLHGAAGLGVRFENLSRPSRAIIRSYLQAFRYRIAIVGFLSASPFVSALGEEYTIELMTPDELTLALRQHANIGLVVIGATQGPAYTVEIFRTFLGDQTYRDIRPFFVYGDETCPPEIQELIRQSRHVVYKKMPCATEELQSFLPRLIEAYTLDWENDRLRNELGGALARLKRENTFLRERIVRPSRLEGVVGDSEVIQRVYDAVERVAKIDTTVMILGETGTGKDLIARALHRLSNRWEQPFLAQNCAALTESLAESELFGHVKGAFTGADNDRKGVFAAADGGTIFLDEVAELTLPMQAKLLRVLQDGEIRRVGTSVTTKVNVRLVCATHQNLEKRVADGLFRQDLYYRLASFIIRVPPLRERHEDIAELVNVFLAQFSARYHREPPVIEYAAIQALEHYAWPGNVRQLQHIIERLGIVAVPGQRITAGDVEEALGHAPELSSPHVVPTTGQPLNQTLGTMEESMVRQALEKNNWVIAKAARDLGMDRSTLSKRLKRLRISVAESVRS